MKIQCPDCGARYQFDPSKATRDTIRIKCGKCGGAFTLKLPERSASPAESTETPFRSSELAEHKVLIVDDARFFRELIVDVLTPLRCTLLTAADAKEALDIARREKPSLILLDLNLPGLDGFGLMREIRGDAGLAGVRLLAMSGVFRQEADVAKALEAGADDFTSKSFRPEMLQDKVRHFLEGR